MSPETVQQLPTDKLSELQNRVQNIAKGFIALHVVLLFYPVLCHPGNYVEDSASIWILTFYVITTATYVLLYIGARKKKRRLLLPFRFLIVSLNALSFLILIILSCTILAFAFYGLKNGFRSRFGEFEVWLYVALSILFPWSFAVGVAIILTTIQRTTKNLYVELGRDDDRSRQIPVELSNISYNQESDQLNCNVGSNDCSVLLGQSNVCDSTLSNECNVNGGRNHEESDLRINLPDHIPNEQNQEITNLLIPFEDSPPSYCETQNTNICINIEPPPSYDDAMKKV